MRPQGGRQRPGEGGRPLLRKAWSGLHPGLRWAASKPNPCLVMPKSKLTRAIAPPPSPRCAATDLGGPSPLPRPWNAPLLGAHGVWGLGLDYGLALRGPRQAYRQADHRAIKASGPSPQGRPGRCSCPECGAVARQPHYDQPAGQVRVRGRRGCPLFALSRRPAAAGWIGGTRSPGIVPPGADNATIRPETDPITSNFAPSQSRTQLLQPLPHPQGV
jgi:hypothetical protein